MRELGLDALVLAQPETLTYATGAFPGVAAFWRRAGAAFLVVPGDPQAPLTAIVGDLQADSFRNQSGIADVRSHRIWVETGNFDPALGDGDAAATLVRHDLATGKQARHPRPAQYDLQASLGLLRDCLREHGLTSGTVGLELGFIAARDLALFQEMMPRLRWADASNLVERLRAIKHPGEIGKLRTAAELAQCGVAALLAAIRPAMDAAAMTAIWRDAAMAEAARRKHAASSWAYIAVAGDGFASGGPAQTGDIIKIDVGCIINGYSSDSGRTTVLGNPSPAAVQVFEALHRAFDAGLDLLQPGVPLQRVYHAVAASMWDHGYETYGRGHFGHGVGASIWSEEWPFISADATALAEPGMVLAFETPYYIKGLGGFIIEDQILVTETGIEVMAPSPRGLLRISP